MSASLKNTIAQNMLLLTFKLTRMERDGKLQSPIKERHAWFRDCIIFVGLFRGLSKLGIVNSSANKKYISSFKTT